MAFGCNLARCLRRKHPRVLRYESERSEQVRQVRMNRPLSICFAMLMVIGLVSWGCSHPASQSEDRRTLSLEYGDP